MFKLLRCFRQSSKVAPMRRWKTTGPSKDSSSQRIIVIQSLDEFNQKIKTSDVPVIVNFSASWCGNCKILSPIIESVVQDNSRKIIMLKVDIDKHIDLALDYRVSNIPTLLGLYQGQIQSIFIGLHEKEKIQDWVDYFLKKTLLSV